MLNHISQKLKVVNVADEVQTVHLREADKYVLPERERETDRQRDRQRDRQTDTERERQTEREKRERERERERERSHKGCQNEMMRFHCQMNKQNYIISL